MEPRQGIRPDIVKSATIVVTLSDNSLFRIDVFIDALINVTYMLILLCIAIRFGPSVTRRGLIITTLCLLDLDLCNSNYRHGLDINFVHITINTFQSLIINHFLTFNIITFLFISVYIFY